VCVPVKELQRVAVLNMPSGVLHAMGIGSSAQLAGFPLSKMEEAIEWIANVVTASVGMQHKQWNHAEGYTGMKRVFMFGVTLVLVAHQSPPSNWQRPECCLSMRHSSRDCRGCHRLDTSCSMCTISCNL